MAVCISLMFGRLGSVVGSNTAASLLDNHCEAAFYLSGSSVIGEYLINFIFLFSQSKTFLNFVYSRRCLNIFHSKHPPESQEG